MNLLEITGLRIGFTESGDQDVLKGIDLKIPNAKICGLVGESGSGKTITAYSILRLLDAHARIKSGSIVYREENTEVDLLKLENEPLRQIRGNKISMVFQEAMAAMNPVLKCGFQVTEVIKAHHNNLSKSEIKDRIYDGFEKVGLTDPARVYNSYPFELSGGQIQRVLIALAMINKPRLIIADEPTTALDVNMQKKVLELFKSIHSELGSSILFISHDLGLVRELCQHIYVMRNGEIVESGDTETLFAHANHPYTKGLIHCRPPLYKKLKKLNTLFDFEENADESHDQSSQYSPLEIEEKAQSLASTPNLLAIQNLSIYYHSDTGFFFRKKQGHRAVNDVSFQIKQGESLGLVGESGSGKTSIGRSIVRLLHPESGEILYNSTDLLKLEGKRLHALRKDIQMIFQDPYSALNPRQKIGDAILEPLEIHGLYNSAQQRKNRVLELLQTVGLSEEHYHRYPHQFSGGQRQRICIARALGVEPKLLVCDEPVSALDVSVQAQILNLFKELQENFGLSYLFISHDLAVVHFLADRIIVLENGKIVEEGPSSELIENPKHPYTKSLIQATPREFSDGVRSH
ncbi:MAG: ABC transporter ATP-binding protein [Saprospiraceae bacterium]|nr:ABC transporter ATP-binding protein [Saprospiraceae bacterium]